jgi:dUTPase
MEQLQNKFNYTDLCLRLLKEMSLTEKDYYFNGTLEVRNMGTELKLKGYDPSEDNVPSIMVPTGIRIKKNNQTQLLVLEKAGSISTGLLVRNVAFQSDDEDQVYVCLLNLSKNEVLIPMGAKLPVQLTALTVYNNFELVDYQKFLKV